jgi:hypothetical protein
MSRLLKPFAELSLKLVAIDTIGDRSVSLQFPASIPQTTFPSGTTPLEHFMERPRGPLADTDGWQHGGIND